MSEPIIVHEDSHIGLTMEEENVKEVSNGLGGTCWVATTKIGSIFGSEVEGECRGIGPTREIALKRLKEDQNKLAESIWA